MAPVSLHRENKLLKHLVPFVSAWVEFIIMVDRALRTFSLMCMYASFIWVWRAPKKDGAIYFFFSTSLVINSQNQRKFLCRGKAWFSERFPKIFFFDKDFGGRRETTGDSGK